MREIKFRAWDKCDKRMMYRDVFDRNWYATPKNDENGCHCIRGISPDDRPMIQLMSFTGLKDKNGVEIYEGDILTDNVVVIWADIFASFGLRKKGWLSTHFFQEGIDPDETEVIGNIHQNPELLEITK